MSEPWKDWIPGVLCKEQVKQLCEESYIEGVENPEESIDPSAINLTLTNEAYRMVKGSVKPSGDRYEHFINRENSGEKLPTTETGIYTLDRTNTYLFKLKEKIRFKGDAKIYGQATAKSTVGRMDVLARLIVDGMDEYEGFDPDGLTRGSGEMYLEITPMTFRVRVKAGVQLSQLRLFRGKPENAEIRGEEVYEPLLHNDDGGEVDGSLSVDLRQTTIGGQDVCAFWANPMSPSDQPIDLWEKGHYDPCRYWKFQKSDEHNRFKINKTHFYILRSKEKISLTEGVAVYCRAIDEAIGEMRIHYAGFVHPCFGQKQDGGKGTPLIFEVRGHDVDVSLKDGEKMARLIFYCMSKPCTNVGESSYNKQTLQLSKIFADWPESLEVGVDGSVKAVEKTKK